VKLLALETATPATDVAVLVDGRVCARAGDAERPHAAALLPCVERALAEAGLVLGDVEGFALSIGPGSFTGLRIGLASVKAFALGSARPVAPVPTLAALAWTVREQGDGLVLACLDARRGELYAAGYRPQADGLVPAGPRESVYRPEELRAALVEPAYAVGDVAAGPSDISIEPGRPTAVAVAEIGARMLARGGGRQASELVPRYLRRAEAEARRTGRSLEPDAASNPAGETL
jgi:tRNA threonylcarbamoyladenosine biosynthesis protein TsaB